MLLIAVFTLGACATEPRVSRSNVELQQVIHDAVPVSWQKSAESTADILPLDISPDLREFVHAAVRSNDGARKQMLSLTNAIIDSNGVGMGYVPDATYSATQAFRSGTGNCLGFSNLLVASARELGLNAEFELVSHAIRWDKVDDSLIGSLHVRVVSFAGGRRMVFDFYPLPLKSGFTTEPLSDQGALAHHFNNLAVQAMQDGDGARAYGLFAKAIGASADIAFIWSNLGTLLSRHGFESIAEAAFHEALAISPDARSALSNLQRLYYRQGRHAEVEEIVAKLEEYRAENPYYQSWLGEQAIEQGNWHEAVTHYKNAIRLKKTEPDFYLQLARSYDELGLEKAARRASRKAEEIETAKPISYSVRRSPPETGTHITRK